jgi:IclR family pca regulon transcriptional regulator
LRPRILELGYAYLSSLGLSEVATPHLEALVATVHESSSVSVLDGDEVVYVARVPTRRIMTVVISVGTRFPAHATSMGRALLAGQSDEWLDGYLASARLSPLTRRTITDPARLRSELMRVRQQGWALVDEELEEGLRAIAAPIHDPRGTVIAAVNVSAPTRRGGPETLRDELLPHLLIAVRRIEEDLRAVAPNGGNSGWRTPYSAQSPADETTRLSNIDE